MVILLYANFLLYLMSILDILDIKQINLIMEL